MKHFWGWLKQTCDRYKRFIYLFILAAALAFLAETLYRHWQGVSSVQITPLAWACLVFATGVTLCSHIWTGWVWGWILEELGQSVSKAGCVQIYLTTNIAKYLPSNLVHLYGRTLGATEMGVPLGPASLSVVLDTLLMASSGLMMGLLSIPQQGQFFAFLGLIGILLIVHPRILQRLVKLVPTGKKEGEVSAPTVQLQRYPFKPLLGEIGFIICRSLGFVITLGALTSIDLWLIPKYMSIYSIGWLMGFIIPGVPGGIGVLELIVSRLLSQPGVLNSEQTFSVGVTLAAVGLHRLVNTMAEVLGTILATLDIKWPLGLQGVLKGSPES
jgi:glycosyltransferase 2 family protein